MQLKIMQQFSPALLYGVSTSEMTDWCMEKGLTTRHFKSGANMITFAAMVMKSI